MKLTRIGLSIAFIVLVNAVNGQISTNDLQQCTQNLACSIQYDKIFQAKLDNSTNYMELELALLKHQINNIIVPLQTLVNTLVANNSQQTNVVNLVLSKLETDLAYDRQILVNVTQGLSTLKDEFHRESLNHVQDVHKLTTELNTANNDILNLQNKLTTSSNGNQNRTTNSGFTDNALAACADKDHEMAELKANLTFFMNSYSTSQKELETIRALESFLQSQVVQMKANLSKAESINHIKDNLIVSLQNQLKAAQQSGTFIPAPGTCEEPLGMKDGRIIDSAITATGSQSGYGPEHARLDNSQGWYTPERTASQDYLQIDTGSLHFITKLATQGAPCCDVMVTNYTLQYSTDGVTWKDYKKDCNTEYLSGNTDTSTVVQHTLDTPVMGRFIRFNVQDFKKNGNSNYVGMRVELYGCRKN